MFCMVAALQYQSCLQTVTLWGQDPNFGLLQLLYSCTAGLLSILSTDLEAAQNSGSRGP
jgi:hypothetical protein